MEISIDYGVFNTSSVAYRQRPGVASEATVDG